jgi:dTDP-L-rhamnose 4-epimerase
MYEIVRYVRANTVGTAHLLEFLAGQPHRIQRVIVASSMSIYGEGAYQCPQCGIAAPPLRPTAQLEQRRWELQCPTCRSTLAPMPTTERKPLEPTSVYAITKRDQEELCLTVGRAYDIPTVALRFFNVYGIGQALSNPYTGVAAIFSSRLLNQRAPMIFEDGLQSRDFVHVSDIVQALLRSLDSEAAVYKAINVGTGVQHTVLDVAETLATVMELEIQPEVLGKYRAGDIRHCYADIALARACLGYEPQVAFQEGIRELVAWLQEQSAEDGVEAAQLELVRRGLAA